MRTGGRAEQRWMAMLVASGFVTLAPAEDGKPELRVDLLAALALIGRGSPSAGHLLQGRPRA